MIIGTSGSGDGKGAMCVLDNPGGELTCTWYFVILETMGIWSVS